MSEKLNLFKIFHFLAFLGGSVTAAKGGLSIKENLGHFQAPGINGPFSWGFLSPFLSKEHCSVQYKEWIRSKSFGTRVRNRNQKADVLKREGTSFTAFYLTKRIYPVFDMNQIS